METQNFIFSLIWSLTLHPVQYFIFSIAFSSLKQKMQTYLQKKATGALWCL